MSAAADPAGRLPGSEETIRALNLWSDSHPEAPPYFSRRATLAQPRPVVKVALGAQEAWLEEAPPDAVRALRAVPFRDGGPAEAASWGVPAEVLKRFGPPGNEPYRLYRVPAWRVGWTFRGRTGSFWLVGNEVVFPNPPRSFLPQAALAAATLSALAFAAALLWPRQRAPEPPAAVPAAAAPAPPRPPASAPRSPSSPPPTAARPIPDALVILVGGEIFRGATTRDRDVVRIRDWEREVEIESWRVDRIDPDAPIALRNHQKTLEAFRRSVEFLAGADAPSRETVAQKLAEAFRLDELWTRLKPLSRQGELLAGLDPLDLLDRARARLEALLSVPKPGVPAPPPPPPPPPAPSAVQDALAALGGLLDPEAAPGRAELAGVREHPSAVQPLVEVLHGLLNRGARDWGLLSDRFQAEAPDRKVDVECSLETASPAYVSGRLSSGSRVTGLKGADGRWTIRLPERDPFVAQTCDGRRNAPSGAGESFRRHLERLPTARWVAASPAQHLEEARRLESEVPAALESSGSRAADFLRMLAAAHAGAALGKDDGGHAASAYVRLTVMGWAPGTDGIWQRPSDRGAAEAGRQLRELRPDLALGALGQAGSGGGFPAALGVAVVRLRRPLSSAAEATELRLVLQRLAGEARNDVERRHAEALLDSIGRNTRCAKCGGDATSTCSACRGRGHKLVYCGVCKGQGVTLRVGQGGGPARCGACSGRSGPSPQTCLPCRGLGKVSCRECPPSRPLPKPDEIAALESCEPCQGQGRTGGRVAFACVVCAGLGNVLVPSADPQAVLR